MVRGCEAKPDYNFDGNSDVFQQDSNRQSTLSCLASAESQWSDSERMNTRLSAEAARKMSDTDNVNSKASTESVSQHRIEAEQIIDKIHSAIRDLIKIEGMVESLDNGIEKHKNTGTNSTEDGVVPEKLSRERVLDTLIACNKIRNKLFPEGIFSDPAWDMMLDLYKNSLSGKPVPVSSLCVASNVAPTTAFRKIDIMASAGMVNKIKDKEDGRRVLVELTESANLTMTEFIEKIRRSLQGSTSSKT